MNDIKRVTLKPVDKDRFELVEPYEYKDIKVPSGFKTNGANIPRVFWSIFPPNSPEYLSAIVVHDFLCDEAENSYHLVCSYRNNSPHERHSQTNDVVLQTTTQVPFKSFKFADKILKEMLLTLGVAKWKVCVFYYSCRIYHKIRYGA